MRDNRPAMAPGSAAFTAGLPHLTSYSPASWTVGANPVPPGVGEQREAQMSINRSVKVSIALVLGGAAVVAAAQSGTQAVGAQSGARPVSAAADNQGNPDAGPPILPPLRPSELAAMRRAEAQQWRALSYRLPAGARYSNAEMNVFAAEGYDRS
jgi:hypothetical protein